MDQLQEKRHSRHEKRNERRRLRRSRDRWEEQLEHFKLFPPSPDSREEERYHKLLKEITTFRIPVDLPDDLYYGIQELQIDARVRIGELRCVPAASEAS